LDTLRAACGRIATDLCLGYLQAATTGRPDAALLELLAASSPARVVDKITAPTLLIQGQADSLFPLSEADANARGITAPVRVAWYTGGHDGGQGPASDQNRMKFLTVQWLNHYVKGEGSAPSNSFTYSRIAGFDPVGEGRLATGFQLEDYPGLTGDKTLSFDVSGPPQQIANPPNGSPAAITSLPQAGALSSFVNGVVTDLPGQSALWVTRPMEESLNVVGSPTVRIRAASPTGEAVVFVKLYDVDQNNQASLRTGLSRRCG
jgi:ABC-2 type transport system ATP-binding protein